MSGTEAGRGNGIAVDGTVTKVSPRTVAETVARFTGLAEAKGLKVFAVIDQAAEARQTGLALRDTVLVLFGTLDRVMPPAMGRHYKALLPNCHLVFVYDAGHEISTDRPEAFAEVVRQFLSPPSSVCTS